MKFFCRRKKLTVFYIITTLLNLPSTNSCCNVTSICICHKGWRCYGDLKLGQNCRTNIHVHHNTVKHQQQIRLRCAWDYQHYYHSHHQSQVYENCLAFIQCGKFVPLAEERQENNHALQQRARAGSLSEILVARGQIVGTC